MVIGIDVGTAYSVGAYLDRCAIPQTLKNREGSSFTPSVVLFNKEHQVTVGDKAKRNMLCCAKKVIAGPGRYMGKNTILQEHNGIQYSSEMISGFIIKKILQDASNTLEERITEAVITAPVYFSDVQRTAMERAAKIAGISLVGILNEAAAAAWYYIHEHNIQGKNLLVYDLGGGSLKITVLCVIDKTQIEVVASDRLWKASGRIFDQFIVDYVRKAIEEDCGIDWEDDAYITELQELYIKAEEAKIQLSSRPTAAITLQVAGVTKEILLTREVFEHMIENTCKSAERKIVETVEAAALKLEDIDAILLAGSSCSIPYIRQKIQDLTGKTPERAENPGVVAAMGAALYAGMHSRENFIQRQEQICDQSIGVMVYTDEYHPKNEVIVPRNSMLPMEGQRLFRTIKDNQSKLKLVITEGEYSQLADVTMIDKLEIELPAGISKDSLIEVNIRLENRQLIYIYVKIPDIGFKQEHQIERAIGMDDDSVQGMINVLRGYEVI